MLQRCCRYNNIYFHSPCLKSYNKTNFSTNTFFYLQSLFWIHCPTFSFTAEQKQPNDPRLLYSLCYLSMAKSYSQHTCISISGLGLLLSVLVWAISISHSYHCKGSLNNFLVSDFVPLHLFMSPSTYMWQLAVILPTCV